MSGTLIALSGGMDSVTALGLVLAEPLDHAVEPVEVVIFKYGSKHNPHEFEAFYKVVRHYHDRIEYAHMIDLEGLFSCLPSSTSALINDDVEVPEGHYQESNMSLTVVPGRNTIFTAILLSIAQSKGLGSIVLGIHSGDHVIYPDCRPAWFHGMQHTVKAASENKVGLLAPFLNGDKTSIIRSGLAVGVPYHLTRTCYTDKPIACGRCGSCQERLEAFANNGIEDPIEYTTRELLPKSK